jgi:hypothetical protein
VASLKNYSNPVAEDAPNLWQALEDHDFARAFLRRVGPAERERFDRHGWAYGDPSEHYGTDPFEVLVAQARAISHALFGDGLSCNLYLYAPEDEATREFLSALRRDSPWEPGLPQEVLDPEGEDGTPPHFFDDHEYLMALELSGEAEAVWRLRRALADRLGATTWHYHPASEVGDGSDRSDHLVLTTVTEYYPDRSPFHDELFGPVVRAWELTRRPPTDTKSPEVPR